MIFFPASLQTCPTLTSTCLMIIYWSRLVASSSNLEISSSRSAARISRRSISTYPESIEIANLVLLKRCFIQSLKLGGFFVYLHVRIKRLMENCTKLTILPNSISFWKMSLLHLSVLKWNSFNDSRFSKLEHNCRTLLQLKRIL